jgi:hypothetical protein
MWGSWMTRDGLCKRLRTSAVLAAGCCCLATAALLPASANALSHQSHRPRGANDTWHYVHFDMKGAQYSGYGCDDFGSQNKNCLSSLPAILDMDGRPAWRGERAAARWWRGSGRLYVGFFGGEHYLSGWMPVGNSERFNMTDGHLAYAGDDNVVSGNDPNKPASEALPGNPKDQGAPLFIRVSAYTNGFPFYVHLGYTFDIRGWVRKADVGSSKSVSPCRRRRRPPRCRPAFTAGKVQPASIRGFSPDSIAEYFLDLAKDEAKNFVLDKLGIGTKLSELEQLKKRLDQVDEHLNQIGAQLNAAIVGLNFDEAIRSANTKIESLESVFRHNLKPILTDVIAVNKAREAKDKAAEETALQKYNTDRKKFADLDGANTFASRANALHLLFQPGSTATGLVTAFGNKLLATRRYLTVADSKLQDAVYTKYEEYQALAEWITSEWDIANGHPDLVAENVKEFKDYTSAQRDPKLAGSLPPDLPVGVVLDRGPYQAKDITSLNKSLLTSPVPIRSAFWQQTPIRDPNWVPNVVRAANAAKLRGFSDWDAAGLNQVESLIAEREPGKSIVDHLKALGLDVTGAPGAIWTRDTGTNNVEFRFSGQHESYVVHDAISLANGSRGELPDRLQQTGPYWYFSEIDFTVRVNQGQVLLHRSTGDTRYF